ncbi:hypothetical protein [Fischerella sp. JS2]|uniref:hypothetical protein n=1 Tax=Fischerella sp. JS2 TaxID=2597771 RepID=UPI0028E5D5DF|nr:hypothetical protein [Fischerella sp. JS2]
MIISDLNHIESADSSQIIGGHYGGRYYGGKKYYGGYYGYKGRGYKHYGCCKY